MGGGWGEPEGRGERVGGELVCMTTRRGPGIWAVKGEESHYRLDVRFILILLIIK